MRLVCLFRYRWIWKRAISPLAVTLIYIFISVILLPPLCSSLFFPALLACSPITCFHYFVLSIIPHHLLCFPLCLCYYFSHCVTVHPIHSTPFSLLSACVLLFLSSCQFGLLRVWPPTNILSLLCSFLCPSWIYLGVNKAASYLENPC